MTDDRLVLLFAYGSLRQEEVQRAVFGRSVDGEPDAIAGYRLSTITIDDPAVVGPSGAEVHRILVATGDPGEEIEGFALRISEAELAVADEYETADYVRVEARLRSGRQAWVYVAP